jgi:methyl-accepting chemotaxis protein
VSTTVEPAGHPAATEDSTTQTVELLLIGLTIGAFIVAIAIGLFVAGRIIPPITRLEQTAQAISAGDLEAGAQALERSFEEIRRVSDQLERGSLDGDVETDRPGQYGSVLDSLASGRVQLSESFTQVSTVSQRLKDGRLDQDIDTDYPGAFGDVLQDLDQGIAQLNDSVEQVQSIGDEVASSSEEAAISAEEIEQCGQFLSSFSIAIYDLRVRATTRNVDDELK